MGVLNAGAGTIHLKNGQTILADSAREDHGHVVYQIGDDTYSISKSQVDRIDTGGAAATPSYSASKEEINIAVPRTEMNRAGEVEGKLIHDGHVDASAIAHVEQLGNPDLSAAAYFVAGRFEFNSGNRDNARRYLERGLTYAPESPAILAWYVATLLKLQRASDAIPYAERASQITPESADAWNLLGGAYFNSNRTTEAIRAWKKSLQLRPDANVQESLAKAERELKAEDDFSQADSAHFTLHFEGQQTSDALRRQMLDTLESHFNELVGELGSYPHGSISVSLYTGRTFFDVTQAPDWAGALYDGKLRIPVEGIHSMTPELSRVLKHELTHSFTREITRGRCPQWLNEGVAQMLEPKSVATVGSKLAAVYAGQRQIPLNTLEGSWVQLPDGAAQLAYYEGLAGVEYIRDTYGMGDVQRLLQRIGEGASTESALRSTIHGGYSDLEESIADYLKRKYGD